MTQNQEEKKKLNLWDAITSFYPKAELILRGSPEEVSKILSLLPFWRAAPMDLFKRTVVCIFYCLLVRAVVNALISFIPTSKHPSLFLISDVLQSIHSFLIWISPDPFLLLIILSFFLGLNGNTKIKMIKDMKRVKDLIHEVQKDYEKLLSNEKNRALYKSNIVKHEKRYGTIIDNDPRTSVQALGLQLLDLSYSVMANTHFIEMNIQSKAEEIENIISKYVRHFSVCNRVVAKASILRRKTNVKSAIPAWVYISHTNFVVNAILDDEIENAKEARDKFIESFT